MSALESAKDFYSFRRVKLSPMPTLRSVRPKCSVCRHRVSEGDHGRCRGCQAAYRRAEKDGRTKLRLQYFGVPGQEQEDGE